MSRVSDSICSVPAIHEVVPAPKGIKAAAQDSFGVSVPALPFSLWNPGSQGDTLRPYRDPMSDRAVLPVLQRIAVFIFQTQGQTITRLICASQTPDVPDTDYALAETGDFEVQN